MSKKQQKYKKIEKSVVKCKKYLDKGFVLWYFRSVLKDTRRKEMSEMDKFKLFGIMDKRGVTQEKLCHDLNMSRSAFSRKCNGKSEFTLGEMNRIMEYLEIESPMGIFFVEKVS